MNWFDKRFNKIENECDVKGGGKCRGRRQGEGQ